MSEAATLPKGLRKEDVEKGMIGKVAELPYLPLIDEKAQSQKKSEGEFDRSENAKRYKKKPEDMPSYC